jgi:hypothetical protein
MQTFTGHLANNKFGRCIGEPDLNLVVGGTRFPIHTNVVSKASKVLANLIKDYEGKEGDLVVSQDTSGFQTRFEVLLSVIYGTPKAICNSDDAVALVSLADYYDSDPAFRAADAYLATLSMKGLKIDVNATGGQIIPSMGHHKLLKYAVLANQYKLRR